MKSWHISLIAGALGLLRPAFAQTSLFTEVAPVYAAGGGTGRPFPAWENMRSAWGDFDADGDLDVLLMGRGPAGPVTKLFINELGGLEPFAFVEWPGSGNLPQLQDGAADWGDLENDGDLDLFITGSVTDNPTGPADVQSFILVNNLLTNGQRAFSVAPFGNSQAHGGCVSWHDFDNDGDLDLLVCGIGGPNLWPFAHLYENVRGSFSRVTGQQFYSASGWLAARQFAAGEPGARDPEATPEMTDVDEVRHAGWEDFNRDGLPDLVLSVNTQETPRHMTLEVWLNRTSGRPVRFERLINDDFDFDGSDAVHDHERDGLSLILAAVLNSAPPQWPQPMWEGYRKSHRNGAAGDWNGDGWMDLAFPATQEALRTFDGENGGAVLDQTETGWVLRRAPGTALPTDWLPGFVEHEIALTEDRQEVVHVVPGDFTNTGRQGLLTTLMKVSPEIQEDTTPPEAHFLTHDPQRGLAEEAFLNLGSLAGRVGGALDAVDINRDGRLDVFESGHDGDYELKSYCGRNQWPAANTPPSVPTGLTAQVNERGGLFQWNAATDAQTPAAALRYAVRVKHGGGTVVLNSGATADGRRMKPGLTGTVPGTEFYLNAHNAGEGRLLEPGTYYWTVQAVDAGGMGSAFAPEQSFVIGTPPSQDSGERQANLPYRYGAMDLGDFDRDGDLDVALAGGGPTVVPEATLIQRNDGPHPVNADTHEFITAATLATLAEDAALRWADADGDGDLDLALSGTSGGQPLTRLYQNENGLLASREGLLGVTHSAMDWGDFDNDGDLDLLVTGYRDRAPQTRLYRQGGERNLSPGQWLVQATTLPDFGNGAVAWGDFDLDGDLDLVLCGDTSIHPAGAPPVSPPPFHLRPAGATYLPHPGGFHPAEPQTKIFRNDGQAATGEWRFTPVLSDIRGVINYRGGQALTARAEWCDMNGDGFPDLILGGMTALSGTPNYGRPSSRVYRNAGPGTGLGQWLFVPGPELLTGFFDGAQQTFTSADWSCDGRNDLLLGGWINGPGSVPLQLLLGDGGIYYDRPPAMRTHVAGEVQFATGLAAFGHFDADLNPDILLCGRWGIQSQTGGNHGVAGRLFLNDPVSENIAPTPPDQLTTTLSTNGREVTLSWGPSIDVLALTGPTYNLHVERVDGQPGGMPGHADLLSGRRYIARRGNLAHHRAWTLRHLPAGEYRWFVQGIDSALAPSAFASAPATFTVPPPQPPVIAVRPPFHQWRVVHAGPAPGDLLALAAGRNAVIALGRRGQLMLSRAGSAFERIDLGLISDLHDGIIETEGATLVGADGVIRTSSDGIVWEESPSGTTATLHALARGGTGWVAAGDGVALHSLDRRAWTPGTLPAGASIHDVCWAMGRYVAVGERNLIGALFTSLDGLTWTETTPSGQTRGRVTSVATDGTRFLAVGTDNGFFPKHNDLFTSTDGLNWSVATTPENLPWHLITHSSAGWLALTNGYQVRRSADGLVWGSVFGESFAFLTALAEDAGRVTVAGTNGVIFDTPSEPLTATSIWTQRSGAPPVQAEYYSFRGMAAIGDTIAAIGSTGVNFLSRDGGLTWNRGPDGGFNGFHDIAAGAGRFVRTSQDGIESSEDGLAWQRFSVTGSRAVAFGNGRFVVARNTGGFMVSTDGLAWIEASQSTPWCRALAFGNGRFLGSDDTDVYSSTDGLTWTIVSQARGSRSFSFARDRFFAAIAPTIWDLPAIHSSADGVTWQPVTGLPADFLPSEIVWHSGRFIAFDDEDTFSSADLAAWTEVPVPASPVAAVSSSHGLVVAVPGQGLLLSPDLAATPPIAVTLSSVGRISPTVFAFTVDGNAGLAVTLERSADLLQWTDVQTFILRGGAESIEIEIPQPQPSEYFRLRWNP